jgi:hypothetical protein
MIKNLLSLIAIVAITLSCKTEKKIEEPRIIIDYSIGINYVTHLYTLAGIGFHDKEYCEQFANTVKKHDLDILRKNAEHMKFGQGVNGQFTSLLFFIPAYANLKTKSEYKQYFMNIELAVKNRNLAPLYRYIPMNQKKMYKQRFTMTDKDWRKEMAALRQFEEIAHVYIDNIDGYLENVYPKIESELEDRSEHLTKLMNTNTVMADWQHATKLRWNYGNYKYLLFRAGKDGPSFNNLSENMNSLYYNMDDTYTIDMFSHEFGIFLMFDSIIPKAYKEMGKKYPTYNNDITLGRVNRMAFEMLAVYYNCKIQRKKTTDYYNFTHSDPVAFFEIYENLYKSGITVPKDMYVKAVDEYMKPKNGYWNNGVKERYKQLTKSA